MIQEYFEFFKGDAMDVFMGILMTIAILILAGLLFYGAYYLIDSTFRANYENYGIVTSKKFTPAHQQIIVQYNPATKTSMPQPIFIPNDWNIIIDVEGHSGNISVNEKTFNKIKKGQRIWVTYSTGRINRDNIYIKNIREW